MPVGSEQISAAVAPIHAKLVGGQWTHDYALTAKEAVEARAACAWDWLAL